MAMNPNIRLDTQEQLMEDAKAKAKSRYDRKLLDDQEEQIKRLLSQAGMADADEYRAMVEAAQKAMEGYERSDTDPDEAAGEAASFNALESMKRAEARDVHGKPINPSGIISYDSVNDPALRNLFPVNGIMNDESKQFRSNNQGRDVPRPTQKKANGPVVEGSKPAATIVNDKKLDSIKDNFVPPMAKDEPQAAPQEEPKGNSNYYMPILGEPKIDEALKAIADKDPELLQLPEVQKLVKEREFWRNKGIDLFTFAPLATDPNASTQAAIGLIDKGDKNLMDAAENLEKLRQRQLDATKATADNLVAQKQVTASMHNGVLNTEAALAQVAIPAQQQAYELRLQAEQVHEAGDEAVQSAIANMQNFVQRLGDMGASAKDVAVLNKASAGLNPSNIREFIETVRGVKVNKAMRRELNERLNAISADAAKYATAMITEKKLREQADFHDARANSLLTAASKLGGQYRIPEWMSSPAMANAAPAANTLSTPFSDEKSDVPAKEAQPREEHPMEEAYGGMKSKPNKASAAPSTPVTPKGTVPSTPVPPKNEPKNSGTVIEPWYSFKSITKLSSSDLDNLFNALYEADTGKDVTGATVGVIQTEQGAEGNAVSDRKEKAVAEIARDIDRFVNTLDAWARNNPKGFSKVVNKLKNVDALNHFMNKAKEGTPLRQLLDNATNPDIRNDKPRKVNYNFGDQESKIASLLMELGYV